jgi:hypothetical protein
MQNGNTKRFAAKLLFQFRVVVGGKSSRRRICEERTVVFTASSAKGALAAARRKGRAAQYDYRNDENNPIYFEFVGVTAMQCLDPVCERDEVWYDVREWLSPMERKEAILPTDTQLLSTAG